MGVNEDGSMRAVVDIHFTDPFRDIETLHLGSVGNVKVNDSGSLIVSDAQDRLTDVYSPTTWSEVKVFYA